MRVSANSPAPGGLSDSADATASASAPAGSSVPATAASARINRAPAGMPRSAGRGVATGTPGTNNNPRFGTAGAAAAAAAAADGSMQREEMAAPTLAGMPPLQRQNAARILEPRLQHGTALASPPPVVGLGLGLDDLPPQFARPALDRQNNSAASVQGLHNRAALLHAVAQDLDELPPLHLQPQLRNLNDTALTHRLTSRASESEDKGQPPER